MDFDEIYKLYFKDIYYYVFSICKNEAVSEDITSETFYKAMKSIKKFDGKKDIRAWLFTIAKNTYFSYYKKNKKIANDLPKEIPTDTNNCISIVDKIYDEEKAFQIHKFIHSMKEPYKEVFTLRIFGELPFEKIGSLFGKSAGWARTTFYRAKVQIQEKMEDVDYD